MSVARFDAAGWLYFTAWSRSLALTVMPGEPALDGWADEARARFERLGAAPDLQFLDEVQAQTPTDPIDSPSEVRTGR